MNFCCKCMENSIKEHGRVSYFSKFREYGINYLDHTSIQLIYFCPWCKMLLPQGLRDEWIKRFENNGYWKDIDSWQDNNDEFRSSKWWKNDPSLLDVLHLSDSIPNAMESYFPGKCCERMIQNLEDDELPLVLFPEISLYAIIIDPKGKIFPIHGCPWCGIDLRNGRTIVECSIITIPVSTNNDPRIKKHINRPELWNKEFWSASD